MPAFVRRQQALEVLASCHQQSLNVDVVQPAQAKAPQLVPVLRLAEERLDPHLAFPSGTLVLRRAVRGADAVDIVGVDGTPHLQLALGSVDQASHPPARKMFDTVCQDTTREGRSFFNRQGRYGERRPNRSRLGIIGP
jgi:hypothetical protein